MNQRLGKQEKLKSKKLIERLFSEGKSLKKFPLKLIYLPLDSRGNPCINTGVSVPKKLIRTAVKRNRIKRTIREVFRKNKYLVYKESGYSFALMFIYISREDVGYEKLQNVMQVLLKRFSENQQ